MDDANNQKLHFPLLKHCLRYAGLILLLIREPAGSKGFTQGKARNPQLINSKGKLYLAFSDEAYDEKISVMRFTGSDWVYVCNPGFTSFDSDSFSFAEDDGGLWVAYQDAIHNSKITVMKYAEDGWFTVGPPGFGTFTNVIHLAVEGNTPYVAFRDDDHSIRASVMKLEDDNWVLLGDAGDLNKPVLMKYSGTAWEKVGEEISSSQGPNTSVAYDSSGTPYVAFKDYTKIRRASVMRFGTAAGTPIRLTEKNDFGIYPNPNQGRFTLKFPRNETTMIWQSQKRMNKSLMGVPSGHERKSYPCIIFNWIT